MDDLSRLEAQRCVKPSRLAGGIEPEDAAAAIGHDTLHQPPGRSVGLQTGRGDQHSEGGEILAMGKPHAGRRHPADLIQGHITVADIQRVLPVLAAVGPADTDRQCMQLRNFGRGNVGRPHLEYIDIQCLGYFHVHHLPCPMETLLPRVHEPAAPKSDCSGDPTK